MPKWVGNPENILSSTRVPIGGRVNLLWEAKSVKGIVLRQWPRFELVSEEGYQILLDDGLIVYASDNDITYLQTESIGDLPHRRFIDPLTLSTGDIVFLDFFRYDESVGIVLCYGRLTNLIHIYIRDRSFNAELRRIDSKRILGIVSRRFLKED